MGIFSKNSGTTSRSTAATLIAKGCTISGKLKLENDIQVDGTVDGQVHVEGSLVVAESGRVKGEVFAKQLIVNGMLEGDCHAEHIQILSNGRVKGKIWSNNLSIEPGGKFFGETAELQEKEVVNLKASEPAQASAPVSASAPAKVAAPANASASAKAPATVSTTAKASATAPAKPAMKPAPKTEVKKTA
ncbi:polymer-forming cytoskeletal protein [Vibrio parahaemolyticus]|uniref:polymer-forming cytoskeletal protein n=1 Tax=Vibrio mediterranei TaxID=689 RepID=UPI004068FE0A